MIIDHLGKPDVPKGQDCFETWKADITKIGKGFLAAGLAKASLDVTFNLWNFFTSNE